MYTLAVRASPDSAVRIAQFALREVAGLPQLPRTRPDLTTVSTIYMRDRRGGGHTEIAIIAGVERAVRDSVAQVTLVELRAWALDRAHQLTPAQRRMGIPNTAMTTNAPAIRTPRAVTSRDSVDARNLDQVLAGFVRAGARIISGKKPGVESREP